MVRLFCVLFLAGLGLAACGGDEAASPATPTLPPAASTPVTFAVEGSVTFWAAVNEPLVAGSGFSYPRPGQPCLALSGYGDIATGMEVKLTADGQVLDVGHLTAGVYGDKPTSLVGKMACRFPFTLTVPSGHKFYTVDFGKRGSKTYSFEEITMPGRGLDFEVRK